MPDSKISAMPAASSVAGADQVPIVQGGVNKRAPVSLIRATLPVATGTVLGGVKIGSGVTVQADGTISVQAQPGTGTDLGYTAATRLLTSSTGADVTLPEATDTVSGLMAAADKAAIAANAAAVTRIDREIGQAAVVTAHTDLVTYISGVDTRVAALEHSGEPPVADAHLTVDNYSGGFIRIIGADTPGKIDLALATTPGPGGAIYPTLGDIPGGSAVWADYGGNLGKVRTAAGVDVLGSTLKEWIRRGSILTVRKDVTDPAHPVMVVELIEDPTPAGSSLSLGNLNSVDDAVDAAPAGKVLGTTATGVWGAVDPPAGPGVPDSTAAAAGTVLTVATAGADPTWEAGVTGLIRSNNIPQWTDKDWPAGSVVIHAGKYWYTNLPVAAGSGGDPGSTGFYPIQLDTILDQLFALGGYRYPLEPYDDTRSYRVGDVISILGDWRVVERTIAVGAGETVATESSALLDVASLDSRIRLRVKSDTEGLPGSTAIANMVKLTQAAYDALAAKDDATFYVIVG